MNSENDEICYICGFSVSMCDPHTLSRMWAKAPYTTPCGQEVELSFHVGCAQKKQSEESGN